MQTLTRIAHFHEKTFSTNDAGIPELRLDNNRLAFNLLLRTAGNPNASQIDVKIAPSLLEIAAKYEENEIVELCMAQIIENSDHVDLKLNERIVTKLGQRLTLDNIHKILYIALRFEQSPLTKQCEDYIRQNEEAVIASIGQSSCTWSTVDFICGLDNLTGSEATLITAALTWVNNEAVDTGDSAGDVLGTLIRRFRFKSVTVAEMRDLERDFRPIIGLYISRMFNVIQIPRYADPELSDQYRILPTDYETYEFNRLYDDDDNIDDEQFETDDDLYINGNTEITSFKVNREVKLLEYTCNPSSSIKLESMTKSRGSSHWANSTMVVVGIRRLFGVNDSL